jgi:hypothetical protein
MLLSHLAPHCADLLTVETVLETWHRQFDTGGYASASGAVYSHYYFHLMYLLFLLPCCWVFYILFYYYYYYLFIIIILCAFSLAHQQVVSNPDFGNLGACGA